MPAHKWTFKSRFRANAYGWKGTALASKRLKEIQAKPAAQKGLTRARRARAAERLYRMATSYKSNGLEALWKKNLEKLIEQYPETEHAKQAKADLGID